MDKSAKSTHGLYLPKWLTLRVGTGGIITGVRFFDFHGILDEHQTAGGAKKALGLPDVVPGNVESA